MFVVLAKSTSYDLKKILQMDWNYKRNSISFFSISFKSFFKYAYLGFYGLGGGNTTYINTGNIASLLAQSKFLVQWFILPFFGYQIISFRFCTCI